MEYYLFITGLLTGMLIGVLIMNRIYNNHSKEMQKIDDDFKRWKVKRHKQFIAELDEIDRVYEERQKHDGTNRYYVNPNMVDPYKSHNGVDYSKHDYPE